MRSGGFHAQPPGVQAGPLVKDRELLEAAILPALLKFSVPLLFTNFLHSLSGTWAAIWVSHVLGPDALTAVVNSNVLLFLILGAVMGVGVAGGIVVGQAVGAEDDVAAKRAAGAAIAFALLASAPTMIAGYIFAPDILRLMHMPDGAFDTAVAYLRMSFLGMPVTFLVIFLSMLLRGAGDARTPMLYTFVWIGLGMAIGPILLTGAFGAPKLGVIGMAIGGLIAGTIALFGLIGAVYRSGSPLALRGQQLRYLKPDWAVLAGLASRGAPMAAETIIVQGAYFVLLAMVNAYGAPTASAYAAAAQLWGYVQMPAIALAASMSSMAAINIGAGQWPRVETLARQGVMLSILMTTATTLIVYALGDAPLKLFLPAGGEALSIARHINFIALWGWIVLAITSGLSAIVRANGAMAPPAIIFFITMWVMRVPFAAFLQPVLGADAIWWSFPLGSIASAALAYAYFRYGGWRKRQRLLPATARPS